MTLELKFNLTKEKFRYNESISVEVTLCNKSSEELKIPDLKVNQVATWLILKSEADEREEEFCGQHKDLLHEGRVIGNELNIALSPGEEVHSKLDLLHYTSPLPPGDYSLALRYNHEDHSASAEAIPFKITSAPIAYVDWRHYCNYGLRAILMGALLVRETEQDLIQGIRVVPNQPENELKTWDLYSTSAGKIKHLNVATSSTMPKSPILCWLEGDSFNCQAVTAESNQPQKFSTNLKNLMMPVRPFIDVEGMVNTLIFGTSGNGLELNSLLITCDPSGNSEPKLLQQFTFPERSWLEDTSIIRGALDYSTGQLNGMIVYNIFKVGVDNSFQYVKLNLKGEPVDEVIEISKLKGEVIAHQVENIDSGGIVAVAATLEEDNLKTYLHRVEQSDSIEEKTIKLKNPETNEPITSLSDLSYSFSQDGATPAAAGLAQGRPMAINLTSNELMQAPWNDEKPPAHIPRVVISQDGDIDLGWVEDGIGWVWFRAFHGIPRTM